MSERKIYFASRLYLGENETVGPGKDHYTAIYKRTRAVPFDRFGANKPVLGYVLHDFASYRPKFSHVTFDEACERRAREIIDLGRQIRLYWSGGIDSTVALISLIKAGVDPDQLEIACSCDSIEERPLFFRKYIVGKYNIVEATSVAESLVSTDSLIVTGELGDQIFGADTMTKAVSVMGPTVLKQRASIDLWIDMWGLTWSMQPDDAADFFFEIISSSDKVGVRLHDMFDLFWWSNFAFKWQDVCLRGIGLSSSEYAETLTENRVLSGLCHFFQSPDFQDWSISRREPKIEVEWRTYKLAAKKYIFDFDGDEQHLSFGTKIGSMKNIWKRYRDVAKHAVLEADPWGFSSEVPKLHTSERSAIDKYRVEAFTSSDGGIFEVSPS